LSAEGWLVPRPERHPRGFLPIQCRTARAMGDNEGDVNGY
jgi:hypothetical protein